MKGKRGSILTIIVSTCFLLLGIVLITIHYNELVAQIDPKQNAILLIVWSISVGLNFISVIINSLYLLIKN